MEQIGFGGGCHWCTEAVFQSLIGVQRVEQGWITAVEDTDPSEAVVVIFDRALIDLQTLITIHLYTHSSTSAHSRRNVYRSAVYLFNEEQRAAAGNALIECQALFTKPIITKLYTFYGFEASPAYLRNYYYSDSSKPFCKTHIDPKLKLLIAKFSSLVDQSKLQPSNTPFVSP